MVVERCLMVSCWDDFLGGGFTTKPSRQSCENAFNYFLLELLLLATMHCSFTCFFASSLYPSTLLLIVVLVVVVLCNSDNGQIFALVARFSASCLKQTRSRLSPLGRSTSRCSCCCCQITTRLLMSQSRDPTLRIPPLLPSEPRNPSQKIRHSRSERAFPLISKEVRFDKKDDSPSASKLITEFQFRSSDRNSKTVGGQWRLFLQIE